MIDFVFTVDYEIYGNGSGSLRDLVLDPAQRLAWLFEEYGLAFVVFAEAVELAKIEEAHSDPDSTAVREQMRALRRAGHEIALHLHPWWANARYRDGRWHLDWSERNISTLEPERVEAIVSAAIRYLRAALDDSDFIPLSFRSGLWAMQPTTTIAKTLARHGVRVDSSVFKGGQIASLGLDYRPACRNSNLWRIRDDINVPDPQGILWEIPIHTDLVPAWQMLGRKRLGLQRKAQSGVHGTPLPRRWRDFLRFRYPRKLDFCRMTFAQMRKAMEAVLADAQACSQERRVVVAIGHSKDFVDSDSLRDFLAFLRDRPVAVKTFAELVGQDLELAC